MPMLIKNDSDNYKLYKTLFDKSHTMMLITDPDSGKILDANKAAIKFYQYKKDELLNMNINEIIAFSEDQIQKEKSKSEKDQRNYLILRHQLKDGQLKCVEQYICPVESGKQKVLYSIIHDITDKKRLQRELEQRERSIRAMIDATQSLIYLIRVDGIIINLNKQAAQLFEKKPKQMLGKNIKSFVSTKDLARLESHAKKVIETQEIFNYQREQAGRVYEVTFYPVFDKDKPVDQICLVARDITDLKKTEKVFAAIETAGAVCHEMNQPLQVVLGNLELLKLSTDKNDPSIKFINTMIQHTEKLGEITKKLTHITRYETKDYVRGSIFDIDKSSKT